MESCGAICHVSKMEKSFRYDALNKPFSIFYHEIIDVGNCVYKFYTIAENCKSDTLS